MGHLYQVSGQEDVAVGAPRDDHGVTLEAGSVLLVEFDAQPTTYSSLRKLRQSTLNGSTSAATGDEFGHALAIGRYDVGVLTMRTEREGAVPSNNYLVGRVKRTLLSNSWIGALVTNRDSSGDEDYNRVYGADAHFQFYERLSFDAHLLRSETPGPYLCG